MWWNSFAGVPLRWFLNLVCQEYHCCTIIIIIHLWHVHNNVFNHMTCYTSWERDCMCTWELDACLLNRAKLPYLYNIIMFRHEKGKRKLAGLWFQIRFLSPVYMYVPIVLFISLSVSRSVPVGLCPLRLSVLVCQYRASSHCLKPHGLPPWNRSGHLQFTSS